MKSYCPLPLKLTRRKKINISIKQILNCPCQLNTANSSKNQKAINIATHKTHKQIYTKKEILYYDKIF